MDESTRRTGWIKDVEDPLDYHLDSREIGILFTRIKIAKQIIRILEVTKETTQKLQSESDSAGRIPPWIAPALSKILGFLPKASSIIDPAIDELKSDVESVLDNITSGLDLVDTELEYLESLDQADADVLLLVPPIDIESSKLKDINEEIEQPKQDLRNTQNSVSSVEGALRSLAPIAKYPAQQYDKKIQQEIEAIAPDQENSAPSDSDESSPIPVLRLKKILATKADESNAKTDVDSNNNIVRLPLTRPLANHMINEDDASTVILKLPSIVDLSYWGSDIKDQGELNACTSHAIASLVEYFQNRYTLRRLKQNSQDNPSKKQRFIRARLSARFLYKVTRRLKTNFRQSDDASANTVLVDNILASYLKTEISSAEQKKRAIKKLQDMIRSSELSERIIEKYIKDEDGFHKKFALEFFDVGASIRQTLKALQLFGIPREEHWPYSLDHLEFDREPQPFCYAYARNYQAVKYLRLDVPETQTKNKTNNEDAVQTEDTAQTEDTTELNRRREILLTQIKAVLAAGFPIVFGFLYDKKFDQYRSTVDTELADADRMIKCPTDKVELQELQQRYQNANNGKVFGHTVLALGYDDNKKAFLIQNSWGPDWGINGYGWLSYNYVLEGLATDWWTLLSTEWVEVGNFGLDNQFGGPRITSQGGV